MSKFGCYPIYEGAIVAHLRNGPDILSHIVTRCKVPKDAAIECLKKLVKEGLIIEEDIAYRKSFFKQWRLSKKREAYDINL